MRTAAIGMLTSDTNVPRKTARPPSNSTRIVNRAITPGAGTPIAASMPAKLSVPLASFAYPCAMKPYPTISRSTRRDHCPMGSCKCFADRFERLFCVTLISRRRWQFVTNKKGHLCGFLSSREESLTYRINDGNFAGAAGASITRRPPAQTAKAGSRTSRPRNLRHTFCGHLHRHAMTDGIEHGRIPLP